MNTATWWIDEMLRRRSLEDADMLTTLERSVPDIQSDAHTAGFADGCEAAAEEVDADANASASDVAAGLELLAARIRALKSTTEPAKKVGRGGIVTTRARTPSGNEMTYITREPKPGD